MSAYLYTIGSVLLSCPTGLNPQELDEEFGGDFAVKSIVGARVDREFVGPADNRYTLTGSIFPFRFKAAGGSDGQTELATLKSMAEGGESYVFSRVDGYRFPDYYLIEKGSVRHTFLSTTGIGRQQGFTLSLVRTTRAPSNATLTNILSGVTSLLQSLIGGG